MLDKKLDIKPCNFTSHGCVNQANGHNSDKDLAAFFLKRGLFLVLLSLRLTLSSFSQPSNGWYIVERSDDRFGNSSYQTTFIDHGLMRIESKQMIFIFNPLHDTILLIFADKMCFWSGRYDHLKASILDHLYTQLQVSIAQLAEKERNKAQHEVDSVFAELKKVSENVVLPPSIQIISTDSIKLINGLKSRAFKIKVDTAVCEQIWVSYDVKPYESIDLKKIGIMSQLFTKPSRISVYRQTVDWYAIIQNGIVMQSVVPTPIGESSTHVDIVKKVNIPLEFFSPPAGYRSISVEELIGYLMDDGLKPDKRNSDDPLRPSYPDLYEFPDLKK